MTQKTAPKPPTKPKESPAVTTKIAEPIKEQLAGEQAFWKDILDVQEQIADTAFGQGKGKGGSTLKDSNLLKKMGNDLLREKGITFDIQPADVNLQVVGDIIIVFGTYIHKWFRHGEEVYKSTAIGGFHTVISPSTNTSYAVHGALTAANTDILFTMLKANTKSEEELVEDYQKQANRQSQREPIMSLSSGKAPY